MYVKEDTVKLIWSDKVKYEVQSDIFPRILIPAIEKTPRKTMTYEVDDTHSWLTVCDFPHQYTFRRDIDPRPESDNLVKIFLTQLFFDFIIRHIHL